MKTRMSIFFPEAFIVHFVGASGRRKHTDVCVLTIILMLHDKIVIVMLLSISDAVNQPIPWHWHQWPFDWPLYCTGTSTHMQLNSRMSQNVSTCGILNNLFLISYQGLQIWLCLQGLGYACTFCHRSRILANCLHILP